MVGVGCFALDKLYGSGLAVITGTVNVIATVPVFMINEAMRTAAFLSLALGVCCLLGYGF